MGETSVRPIIRVAQVAVPSHTASGLFGIREVLKSVGVAFEAFVTREMASPGFEVSLVSSTGEPFVCASGVELCPDHSVDTMIDADIVVVSGMFVSSTERCTDIDPRMIAWIAAQHAAGKQVVSACTGAVLLAEAGLLDGKEATTHWAWRDHFRTVYPHVSLRLERNLCCADKDHRVVTAGGSTAWQELALYLVARHIGLREAVRTAKFWLIPWQGDLQSPYVAMPRAIPHDDRAVAACQAWIADNYALDNPVARMIEHAGLTRSTFRRRFLEATGYAPIDYVHALRIEEAKQLLETGSDALNAVARDVGYEDEASFRKLFKRRTGITPSEHRRQFGVDRFRRLRDGSTYSRRTGG
jgi:transcriptional regulator GlxA family with amidase domain